MMFIDERINLLQRQRAVIEEQGRTRELLDLDAAIRAVGLDRITDNENHEITLVYIERLMSLTDTIGRIIASLTEKLLSLTESKESKDEAEKRLHEVLIGLEEADDFLSTIIDIENLNLFENETEITKRVETMRNRNDEYYKILVDASSTLFESRNAYVELRRRLDDLRTNIRMAGI
ncbi:TPA: hypothetical protein I6863_003582 [Vibrio cholerae]|nr:hypothetical protein [Vibrio cholerae]HAS4539657.1 hypothetical protein [Vibrio cholerae]HAS4550930.1 hypothetical protein [Vibrio cholerae]